MQTQIEIQAGKIVLNGPYSEKNNEVWRSVGGKFAGGNWVLPDCETARLAVAELFGVRSEEVDALVPYGKWSGYQILQIGGYVLAQRRGRDYRVQMPSDVSLASGAFAERGGSVRNPSVAPSSDVVFRLRCRRSFAERHGLTITAAPIATIAI